MEGKWKEKHKKQKEAEEKGEKRKTVKHSLN